MSTVGLRKRGDYESALAQAMKDESHVGGILSPYMQLEATKAINNPEFQRVRDRMEEDLGEQTKAHMEHQQFKSNVTNLAVEAQINRSDLDYIISNLHRPPPPPAPPPPSSDAAADRERLLAELDGMAQMREKKMRDEMMADRVARDLAAQKVETPAQAIVNHYHQYQTQPVREVHHHLQTPIYIPTPQVPAHESASDHMRSMGRTFHQMFLAQNTSVLHLNLHNRGQEIPI